MYAKDHARTRDDEKFLRAAQEWRVTVDAMRGAVCLLDRDARIRRCNQAMRRLLRQPFPAILGRNCWKLTYGTARAPTGCAIASRHKGRAGTVTLRVGERWFDVATYPIRDAQRHLVGGVHVMTDITERKLVADRLKRYGEELRSLSVRMSTVEEAERRRLARELHDRVGQHLAALGINLNYVRRVLPASMPAPVHERLDLAIKEIKGISESIRGVMRDLRPEILDDYGVIAALRDYAQRFALRTGLDAKVVESRPWPRFPAVIETALFRIAQEALTNVAKHARATQVTLVASRAPAQAMITISDNGVGFATAASRSPGRNSGWGLLTMRERANAIDAGLQVQSQPGGGTRVMVRVPIQRRRLRERVKRS